LPEDWDPEKADHYRYVQGPGMNNSLGLVKFNFRNSFSVYLHDTNHRELFRKGYRALSSGCVRVEDPLKLAGYVLEKEENEWTKEKLDEMIALGETKNVGLKKGTHVHQLYWTAWMDQGGLQFRNDVYNLDKILYKKLRQ
jgi:murein L,D-transpeptidase YcbB/YkuD